MACGHYLGGHFEVSKNWLSLGFLENDMRGEEERNIASCEVLPTFLRVKTFKRQ